jgi:hypothetical protein
MRRARVNGQIADKHRASAAPTNCDTILVNGRENIMKVPKKGRPADALEVSICP